VCRSRYDIIRETIYANSSLCLHTTGEFGVVYKAQHTEPEGDIGYKTSTVAVKTLKGRQISSLDSSTCSVELTFNPGFFDNSQVNKIMEESIKMKHFDHPNVLHLIGVCLDAGPAPYVVMPYMANGSLLHYLKKERNNIVLPVGVDDDVVSDSIISDCAT
jgi:serine/threonine protein kinase